MQVSIPNGKPGPLRRLVYYQGRSLHDGFNPKREARPSQTVLHLVRYRVGNEVSIPNGKPGPLRLGIEFSTILLQSSVSIPNGKPGPLRHGLTTDKIALKQLFQSQTGSQALSDRDKAHMDDLEEEVSIPNGKPGPLRRFEVPCESQTLT